MAECLGVTLSDHMDSILFSPKDGTADIYANYNFSTLFPNGLSGSRPDQDLVLYSFLGDKEQSSLTTNKAKAEAASTDLFSGTLTMMRNQSNIDASYYRRIIIMPFEEVQIGGQHTQEMVIAEIHDEFLRCRMAAFEGTEAGAFKCGATIRLSRPNTNISLSSCCKR